MVGCNLWLPVVRQVLQVRQETLSVIASHLNCRDDILPRRTTNRPGSRGTRQPRHSSVNTTVTALCSTLHQLRLDPHHKYKSQFWPLIKPAKQGIETVLLGRAGREVVRGGLDCRHICMAASIPPGNLYIAATLQRSSLSPVTGRGPDPGVAEYINV